MALRYSTGLAQLLAGGVANDASFCDVFNSCVIDIFAGTQPADPDLTEGGSVLLASMTLNGDPFVEIVGTNGLVFENKGGGVIGRPTSAAWVIVPVASGAPGWARCYSKDYVKGASTTAVRFDIACGVGYGEGRFAQNIALGVNFNVGTFAITLPRL